MTAIVCPSLMCLFCLLGTATAVADECASKFVGTWEYAGGSTTVNSDGTANPHCFGCVAVQDWTCSGDTYFFSNRGSSGRFSATLTDQNHMQGSGVLATRIGGSFPQQVGEVSDGIVKRAVRRAKRAVNRFAKAGLRLTKKLQDADDRISNTDSCAKQTYPYAGNATMCEIDKKTDGVAAPNE